MSKSLNHFEPRNTIESMEGIDSPTIDRCLSTAQNALDELVNALEATASITLTPEAMNRANAARMARCRLRELEAVLGVSRA